MSGGGGQGGGRPAKPSSEAFWWALFSAGGVMAALFVPAFILATGFLLPSSDDVAEKAAAVWWWPVRVALFGIVALSLFHCAHRIRHTLMDLGMRRMGGFLKLICYGGAVAGCAWLGMLLAGV